MKTRILRTLVTGIILSIGAGGCSLPSQGEKKAAEPFKDVAELDFFRGDTTIAAKWRYDGGAEHYILMRAVDGINGTGAYEEVYRGKDLFFTDRTVEKDIRYVYRLDKAAGGKIQEGEETSIGVGIGVERDKNEPNNTKEQATELGSYTRANIYYFRYSDGRELRDTDWYKVAVKAGQTVNVKITEEGAGSESSLWVNIGGERVNVVSNQAFAVRNESAGESYAYIEVCPEADAFVASGMVGGTVRFYRIELDTGGSGGGGGTTNPGGSSPGGDNGNGGGTTNPGGSNPGEVVEESVLFTADGNGRIVFYTNEKAYANHAYTFWRRLEEGVNDFESIQMTMVKESGQRAGGYGYFFQEGDVPGYGDCMLVLLIHKDGNYLVGKAVAGEFEVIKWWTYSVYLRQGYGVGNTVKVRWDGGENKYEIQINGMVADWFEDIQEPRCKGGGSGVVAVVTGQEQFPGTPVRVRYTL